MKQILLILALLVFLVSCKKEEQNCPEPNTIYITLPPPIHESITKYLGHRGSGSDSWSGKDPLFPQENTYDAIVLGSQMLDGAEMDVQMSTDGTIWVWHDDKINNSLPQPDIGVPCLSDADVVGLLPSGKVINRLDTVLEWLSNNPNKEFSLDIKGYFTSCSTLNLTTYFDEMTDSLTAMLTRYNLMGRVKVETDYQYFLDVMKTKSPIVETYLLAYGNLNSAINTVLIKDYDGVSMAFYDTSLNATNMKTLRDNGLKIQLWSLYNTNDVNNILIYEPDYIQTGLLNELSVSRLY